MKAVVLIFFIVRHIFDLNLKKKISSKKNEQQKYRTLKNNNNCKGNI
jgi:hypothetical protein